MITHLQKLRSAWARYTFYLVLLVMAAAKVYMTYLHHVSFYLSEDGSYYHNLIENLMVGRGFVTHISPFHHGLPSFPYPSIVYPVWPLVAAAVGKLTHIDFVLFYLPALLYFVSLGLAFWVGRLYWPHPLTEVGGLKIHGGHLIVLCLGLNKGFFLFTSRPYTEGLAYTLLFIGLGVAHRFFTRPTLITALGLGMVATAALLTRSQMILFYAGVTGAAGALFVLSPKRHKFYLLGVVAMSLVALVCYLPFGQWLAQPALNASFGDFLKFSSYAHTPGLLPPVETEPSSGLLSWILVRLSGLKVGFYPTGRYSYYKVFAAFSLAPPLVVGLLLWRLRRARHINWRALVNQARAYVLSPQGRPLFFLACFAAGSLLSIHIIHLRSPTHAWYFASRHALPAAFAFCLALGWLLKQPSIGGRLGLVLLAVATFTGASNSLDALESFSKWRKNWPRPEMREATEWLDGVASEERPVVVVTHLPYAKTLRPFTPHVSYRALDFADTPQIAAKMFDKLSADYLVLWLREGKLIGHGYRFAEKGSPEQVPGFSLVAKLERVAIYERQRPAEDVPQ